MVNVPYLIIILFFLFLFLGLGIPISYLIGGLTVISSYLFFGPERFNIIFSTSMSFMTWDVLMAIPLFIFMGCIVQFSGMGDRFFRMMHAWMGPVNGGLAMGVVIIGALFGAMSTGNAATMVSAITCLPAMLKAKYGQNISLGVVCVSGLLGVLIPPSFVMIVYGALAQVSVGKLFMAGLLPGLLTAAIFIIYVGIICYFKPELGPAIAVRVNLLTKLKYLLSTIEPIMVIIFILGGIYTGLFSPTESAGVGVITMLAIALIHRDLDWYGFKQTAFITVRITSMLFFLIVTTVTFGQVLALLGIQQIMIDLASSLPFGKWGVIISAQLIILLLGMVMDDGAIMMLFTPVIIPVMRALGVDIIWFGIIFIINLNISMLSPPYGFMLFQIKGILMDKTLHQLIGREITMMDLYKCVFPFIGCQVLSILILMLFPQIVLFIPNLM